MNYWSYFGYFAFGLIGVLAHILFKLRNEGKMRFVYVWQYIKANQIPVALSIFSYFIIYVLWNSGALHKLLPLIPTFELQFTWGTPLIAYLADSIFRNVTKDIGSAIERSNGKK